MARGVKGALWCTQDNGLVHEIFVTDRLERPQSSAAKASLQSISKRLILIEYGKLSPASLSAAFVCG